MIAVGRESIENVIDFSGGPSTKAGVLPSVRENLSVLNTLWIAPKLRQNIRSVAVTLIRLIPSLPRP
jgi:hypothetical protein